MPKETNTPIRAWALAPPSGQLLGDRFCGPMEDVNRLESAIVDAHESGCRQIVLLRYDPHELLDTTIPIEELQPVASGVAVQVETTSQGVLVRRIDDWPVVVH